MDTADYGYRLADLSDAIHAAGGGQSRPSFELISRIGALTAGQTVTWESARFEIVDSKLDVEIVVFTLNAVVRATCTGNGDVAVTAFPRRDLRKLVVVGGDQSDWSEIRDPIWPPDGRVVATYGNGEELTLPLNEGSLSKPARISFGDFLPTLFADLGR